jgi:hypothetical protein
MHALDFDRAYLNGAGPESVRRNAWLDLLTGMELSFPYVEGKEVRLNLPRTYGLRFSGRHWFIKLHVSLLLIG